MKTEKFDDKFWHERLADPQNRSKTFDMLVRKMSPQVYWQIRRLVFSHDDANDIMQNAFLKAWTNIDSFRGDSKVSTWIFRIAINEALSFLQRKRDLISLDSDEATGVFQLEADTDFNGDKAQLEFQKAIASLPDKQRLVFNIKYFDEMKYEEMSKILGTSVGALKASYHIAVEKITAKLKEQEYQLVVLDVMMPGSEIRIRSLFPKITLMILRTRCRTLSKRKALYIVWRCKATGAHCLLKSSHTFIWRQCSAVCISELMS